MDNKQPLNNNKQPKMPKFNMNWIYGLIIMSLIMFFFMDGGKMLAGSAQQDATFTKFKEYVNKGYANNVVVNTDQKKLKMYVKPANLTEMLNNWELTRM